MTRIERKMWSPERGRFVATGETADVDIDAWQLEAERPAQSSGRFLKGPIPWAWITTAAVLPGQALLVGLCIWRLAGATKNHTVSFGNADLKPLGIGRAAKSRALRAHKLPAEAKDVLARAYTELGGFEGFVNWCKSTSERLDWFYGCGGAEAASSGIGLRLGANVGYLKFTDSPTWNPF